MTTIVRNGRTARLFFVALLSLAPLAAAQDDVADKVARFARISADKGAETAWPLAIRLKELGPKVIGPLEAHLEKASPAFRMAAASPSWESMMRSCA